MKIKYYFLLPNSQFPCGVEDYAQHFAQALEKNGQLGDAKNNDVLVLNFPLVAWKKVFFLPLFSLLKALFSFKKRIIFLHEWNELDWKRRLFIAPNLLLTSEIYFSCPYVRGEFSKTFFSNFVARKRKTLSILPAFIRPQIIHNHIDGSRFKERLVLGHFGSIYPRKQSLILLEIARALLDMGENPYVLFIGSFVKGFDGVEASFNARVKELGLQNHVFVTGYVKDGDELFDYLSYATVFVYPFKEGLTSRRTSVLTVCQMGVPVLTSEPILSNEFEGHEPFEHLITAQVLHFIARDASALEYAQAVIDVKNNAHISVTLNAEQMWDDATKVLEK